ncbi:helix-turn-helix domain-containing protein [Rhizobium sp. LjRoot254]|uniref:helix-turn-helix domain-containing protein n=1 Tax=Rhizobium sp. LjRoot254 TaxID=3342297 RepID=UPI003ECCB8CA
MYALSSQIRAARALLGWSISELAARANVSRNTIGLMERNEQARNYSSRQKVAEALEAAGVRIFPREGTQGAGVRFMTVEDEERALRENRAPPSHER